MRIQSQLLIAVILVSLGLVVSATQAQVAPKPSPSNPHIQMSPVEKQLVPSEMIIVPKLQQVPAPLFTCPEPNPQGCGSQCYETCHTFTITVRRAPEIKNLMQAYLAAVKEVTKATSASQTATAALSGAQQAYATAQAQMSSGRQEAKDALVQAQQVLAEATAQHKKADAYLNHTIAQREALRRDLAARGVNPDTYGPPKIELKGTGFAHVYGFNHAFGVPTCQNLPHVISALLNAQQLKMWPAQPITEYCLSRVRDDETILSANNNIPRQVHEFMINRTGSWQQELSIDGPRGKATEAVSKITVTEYSSTPDLLTIKGCLIASGRHYGGLPTGSNLRVALYGFSHAGLKITGGPDIGDVEVDWGPSLSTSVAGGRGWTYDPVSLKSLDKTGRTKSTADIFSLVMGAEGKEAELQWRPDGNWSVDADVAQLEAKLPAAPGMTRPHFKLGVVNSAVSERIANGAVVYNMPALGTRTRPVATLNPSAGVTTAPAQLQTRGISRQPLKGSIQRSRLAIPIPKLLPGEKFELRLGGGGGQSAEGQ
jgi:hypothetical protein